MLQLHSLQGSFTSVKQQLASEQASSQTLKTTTQELQQRLSNLRATSAHHTASTATASQHAKQGELYALTIAEDAKSKLVQVTNQLQQLKQRLAAEQASNSSLQQTADEYKQRLTHLQATTDYATTQATATAAAAVQEAEAAAAEQQRQASVVSELTAANQQLQELNEKHGQELQEAKQQLAVAQEEAAAVVRSAEAAVHQQQEEFESIKYQLEASQKQAMAAKAAEAAARAQVLVLQQQLEQHQAEAQQQDDAMDAVKAQLNVLKAKAAENRKLTCSNMLQVKLYMASVPENLLQFT